MVIQRFCTIQKLVTPVSLFHPFLVHILDKGSAGCPIWPVTLYGLTSCTPQVHNNSSHAPSNRGLASHGGRRYLSRNREQEETKYATASISNEKATSTLIINDNTTILILLTSSSIMFFIVPHVLFKNLRDDNTILPDACPDDQRKRPLGIHYFSQQPPEKKWKLRNQKSYDITFCDIRKKTPKYIYEKKKSNYYQQRNRVAAEIAAWKKEGRTNKNLEGALIRKENGSVDEKMEKKLTTKPMRAIGLASNVEMSMAYGAKIIHWSNLHVAVLPTGSPAQFRKTQVAATEVRAMDHLKDTLQRLDNSLELVNENISMVAAKLAI
ncbi:hypothetical protein D5086_033572 [Populus alba]|uniref:Uncharacterized protein n=1 Tax=Populus alba TaxID=43335 RepID=A0ACC4AH83_POPAL